MKVFFYGFTLLVGLLCFSCQNGKKTQEVKTVNNKTTSVKETKGKEVLIASKGSDETRVAVSNFMDAIVFSNVMNLELQDHGINWNFKMEKSTISALLEDKADVTMMVWEYHNKPEIAKEHPEIQYISSISTNAREGFVVPEYTGSLSVKDVKKNKNNFVDTIFILKRLYGIRMETEQIIKTYELPMTIKLCSEKELMSDMLRLYKQKKGFLASGWYPSLMFGLMDLNMVDRPTMNASERVDINIYATKKWCAEHPKEVKILKKLHLDNEFFALALDVMMKYQDDLGRASRIIYSQNKKKFEQMLQW
ncbi:glycine betaine ABC transporter substrate-binding protein [Prolixibacteraceae bacterium]|nr:glycine betaine ABC transporter substrate-binding protein [Prolixibacteraceae bacterium]